MTTQPDILDLIDYQIGMATNGQAPTLWFIHAVPALRKAQREIRRLRALCGEEAAQEPIEHDDDQLALFQEAHNGNKAG